MKKIISLLLALVMVMGLAVGASAASIEVQDVIDDETYTAYKILHYTKNDDGDEKTENDAYSYYLTTNEYNTIGDVLKAAGFEFTASSDGTEYFVSNAETFNAPAAAEYLGAHVADLDNALYTDTVTGADGKATFTGLTTGYYFVTSSAGSLCALHSEDAIATAVEKNTVPTIDKKEKLASGTKYEDGPIDVKYGDTVYYQIVITDGIGTNKNLIVQDELADGLTFVNNSLTVSVDGKPVEPGQETFIQTVNDSDFVLNFSPEYVASLDENDTIIVTYSATVNENATVDDDNADNNKNTVQMEYSEQTISDTVYVATYDFQLKKTDGEKYLPGAGFKLYDAETGGNEIKVGEEDNVYYVGAEAGVEIMVDSADGVNIRGLAPGTYYLEETTVPDGYNKLASRQPVEIKTGAKVAVEVEVENNAGSELPSTGGIGTTLFYVIGGLLMVGAVVVMVTKKRIS